MIDLVNSFELLL